MEQITEQFVQTIFGLVVIAIVIYGLLLFVGVIYNESRQSNDNLGVDLSKMILWVAISPFVILLVIIYIIRNELEILFSTKTNGKS